MSILRFDKGEIRNDFHFTEEGFLKGTAVVTKTGVFSYRNFDGTERRELRHPEHVQAKESLDTIKMIPLTNDHPAERLVTTENYKNLAVGYTGEDVHLDGIFVKVNFVVSDAKTIESIVNGKRQLSLGYTLDIDNTPGMYDGQEYHSIQTNIKYNHLAIVDIARAGIEAQIKLDSGDAIEINNFKEEAKMAKKKVKIPQIKNDQEASEEIELMLAEEEADPVEDLVNRHNSLLAELEEVKAQLEKATAERDQALEEAKELVNGAGEGNSETEEDQKEQTAENRDSSDFEQKVKERVSLIKFAEKFLNNDSGLHDLSDEVIKKQVIRKRYPKSNLDGKSKIYIDARFDALKEDVSDKVLIGDTKETKTNKDSADSARQRMIERMKNAYKGGK